MRFKRVEDLALDVIGEAIRRVPVKKYLDHYEEARRTMNAHDERAAEKKAPGKSAKPVRKKS